MNAPNTSIRHCQKTPSKQRDVSQTYASLSPYSARGLNSRAFVLSSECYYELSSAEHVVCSSAARLNASVDLVCRFQEHHLTAVGTTQRCDVTDITWYRTSGVNTYEIKTSSKYAVWESIRGGYGAPQRSDQQLSLLRVRHFDLDDVARYSCHVTCDYGSGLSRVVQHHSDVCLEEADLRGREYITHV